MGTPLLRLAGGTVTTDTTSGELAPRGNGIGISISVLDDPAHAVTQANDTRAINRELHRTNLVRQDHNLIVEYRDRAGERLRVARALREVKQSCAG